MSHHELDALGWTAELDASLGPGLGAARVSAQHRGAYDVLAAGGERRVRAAGRLVHAGELPAVGDWVGLAGDTIEAVLPRRSAFVRQAAGRSTEVQVLAANVDVAFLVTSLDLDLEPRRLERYLTAARESGAGPAILLTKADACPNVGELRARVETVASAVPIHVVSAVSGLGMDEVEAYLRPGVTAVLLGSSGVGKSTLVNRLVGAALLRTQPVRADDGKGRHTTSHRQLMLLPGGGMIVDTPGIRELQLWEGDTAAGFADVEELAGACRFVDCDHVREPGCAVLAAVDDGTLLPERLRSYRELERELHRVALRQDARLRADARRNLRRFERSLRKNAW